MSEEKFTKGPWVIDGNPNDYLISNETGFGICQTVLHDNIDKINAHLIAVAPEMYEFLDSLQLSVADSIKRDELLSKARGEQ